MVAQLFCVIVVPAVVYYFHSIKKVCPLEILSWGEVPGALGASSWGCGRVVKWKMK